MERESSAGHLFHVTRTDLLNEIWHDTNRHTLHFDDVRCATHHLREAPLIRVQLKCSKPVSRIVLGVDLLCDVLSSGTFQHELYTMQALERYACLKWLHIGDT